MNRIITFATLLFISCTQITAMGADDDGDIALCDIRHTSANSAQIYNSDFYEEVSEHLSAYRFPMNLGIFESEEIKRKFESINDFLFPHHLRITLKKENNKVAATFNQIHVSAINTGSEQLIPFHQVDIPVGPNSLNNIFNKRLIERRLQQLKDLALGFKEGDARQLTKALRDYRQSVTFSDKMKFTLINRVKHEIESDLAFHIRDTLVLPFTHAIANILGSNQNTAVEKEIEELTKKMNAEEPILQKILDLKNRHKELAELTNEDHPDPIAMKQAKENFTQQFESTTSLLAEQDTV